MPLKYQHEHQLWKYVFQFIWLLSDKKKAMQDEKNSKLIKSSLLHFLVLPASSPCRGPLELYQLMLSRVPVTLHVISMLDPSFTTMGGMLARCIEVTTSDPLWPPPAFQQLSSKNVASQWERWGLWGKNMLKRATGSAHIGTRQTCKTGKVNGQIWCSVIWQQALSSLVSL